MKKKRSKILSGVYLVLIYTFLFLPVAAIIIGSVNTNSYNNSFDGFTFAWYGELLENDTLLEGLAKSIILAVSSTVLSVIIGTLAAFGMYRFKFEGVK